MQSILAICSNELGKLAVTVDKIHNTTSPSVFSLEVASVAATILSKKSNFRDCEDIQIACFVKTEIKLMSTRKIA